MARLAVRVTNLLKHGLFQSWSMRPQHSSSSSSSSSSCLGIVRRALLVLTTTWHQKYVSRISNSTLSLLLLAN